MAFVKEIRTKSRISGFEFLCFIVLFVASRLMFSVLVTASAAPAASADLPDDAPLPGNNFVLFLVEIQLIFSRFRWLEEVIF